MNIIRTAVRSSRNRSTDIVVVCYLSNSAFTATSPSGDTYWEIPQELPSILSGHDDDAEMRDSGRLQNWSNQLHVGFDRIGCRFYQYDTESSTTVLVDHGKAEIPPEYEFDAEYQQVVDGLRAAGREIPAEDLIEMLRDIQEDPEEPEIKLYSLRAMARFLIKHRRFYDPIIGPDPIGIMQAEWHIIGDGLLVMAFLDDNHIHCVAQADATLQSEALNRSVQLTEDQAVEEFGHLVPLR